MQTHHTLHTQQTQNLTHTKHTHPTQNHTHTHNTRRNTHNTHTHQHHQHHTHTHTPPPPSPHTHSHARTSARTHMHATHTHNTTQHIEHWPVCGLAGVPPPPQTQAGCSTTAWSPAHPGCHCCTGGEPPWPGHSSRARSPPQSPTTSSAQTVNHLGQDIHHVHVLHNKYSTDGEPPRPGHSSRARSPQQVQHRRWTTSARTFITCTFSTTSTAQTVNHLGQDIHHVHVLHNKYSTDGEPPRPGHSSRARSPQQVQHRRWTTSARTFITCTFSTTSTAQTVNHLSQDIHHVHVLHNKYSTGRWWTTSARTFITCTFSTTSTAQGGGEPPQPGHSSRARSPQQVQHRRWTTSARTFITCTFSTTSTAQTVNHLGQDIHHVHVLHNKYSTDGEPPRPGHSSRARSPQQVQHRRWTTSARTFITCTFSTTSTAQTVNHLGQDIHHVHVLHNKYSTDGEPPRPGHSSRARSPQQVQHRRWTTSARTFITCTFSTTSTAQTVNHRGQDIHHVHVLHNKYSTDGEPPWPGHSSRARSPQQVQHRRWTTLARTFITCTFSTTSTAQTVNHRGQDIHHVHVLHNKYSTDGEPPWPGHSSRAHSPQQVQHRRWTTVARTFITCTFSTAKSYNKFSTDGEPPRPGHSSHACSPQQVQHRQWTSSARTFITCTFSTAKSYNKFSTDGEPPRPGHSSHARSPPQSRTTSSAQTVNHLGQDIHHMHVLHRKVIQQVQHRRWTTSARTFITCTFSTAKSYNKFSTDSEPPRPGHSSRARSPPQSPTTSSAQTENHLGQDIHHAHVLHRKVLQQVLHRWRTTSARTFITRTFSTAKSYNKFSTDGEPPRPGHSSRARSPPQSPTTRTAKAAAACASRWGEAQTGTSQRLVKDCFRTLRFNGCRKNKKISRKVLPPGSWGSWAGPPCLWCSAVAAACGSPRAETGSPNSTLL